MFKKIIAQYFELPSNLYSQKHKYELVGSFFGAGYFKKAPGTFTSLLTLILGLIIAKISSSLFIIITTLVLLVGFFVCEKILESSKDKDPSFIVIDEVAGMLLAMLLVSNSIILSFVAFIIFRILDIKKPWLIGLSETSFKGSTAVMMDDILAGFATLLIVTFLSVLF
jgi:phosphatidylglycerophosphatase A